MNLLKVQLIELIVLFSAVALSAEPHFGERPFIDIYKVPDKSIEQGHIRIKLSNDHSTLVQSYHYRDRDSCLESFGIEEVDALNLRFGVMKITPVFGNPAQNLKYGWRHIEWGLHLWFDLEFDSQADVRDIVMAYRDLTEDVQWSEPVYSKVLNGVNNNLVQDLFDDGQLSRWTPNDPSLTTQWHYNNTGQTGGTVDADIDLPEAWDFEKGSSAVVVAVIDQGIQTDHPDLAANMWINTVEITGNGVDDDGNGYVDDIYGYNFANNTGTIAAGYHATHVAGTISAVTNNSVGVSGIAGGSGSGDGVRLMSCQVFSNSNGGFDTAPIYAADNGAAISQNSWSYNEADYYNQSVLDAIDYFNANGGGVVLDGGITIFAAGNSYSSGNWYPACYNGCFAVAATDKNDVKADFSNYGAWVDVSAPGTDVYSTYTGSSYRAISGTSMACPHTSGVAALVLSLTHRNGRTISNDELDDIIRNCTDNIYGVNNSYLGMLGTGRINAYSALLIVDPTKPVCTITSPTNGTSFENNSTVTVNVTATDSDGTITSVAFYINDNTIPSFTDYTSPYTWDWNTSGVSGGAHTIKAIATDNDGKTGQGVVTIYLLGPELAFGISAVSDLTGNNNGFLDPGETASLTIPLNNIGGTVAPAGTATLTCISQGITVITGTASFSPIAVSGHEDLTFSITADPSIRESTVIELVYYATAETYTASKSENLRIGTIVTITIGNGTLTQHFPLERLRQYSGHEAIYLASQILTPCTIKSLGFYKASGTDVDIIEAVTIYMKHTVQSTLSTGDYSTEGYTQVYSGNFPNTSTSGWMEVELDNLFEYDGSSNLALLIIKGFQYHTVNFPTWTYSTTPYNQARQSSEYFFQPTTLEATTNLPNLKLHLYLPEGFLHPVLNLTANPGDGVVNLTWDVPFAGTPISYNIFRNGSPLTAVTGLTYADNNVVNGTTYSYYLTAVYSGGESAATEIVMATPHGTMIVIIGEGTSTTGVTEGCPINIYKRSLHGQSVYTKTELNNLGVYGPINVTQLGFYVASIPGSALVNFVVRMKHTTATDVSSWQTITNMVNVFSSVSYIPVAGDYDMLILSTPFTWNGTDNIVIDTAFDRVVTASSTGTVRYSPVTNGYRYVRDGLSNQANIFEGGSTSIYRPNVKLALVPILPELIINPTAIAFGDLEVGSTSVQQFTIYNSSDQALTGTITIPPGYTVAEVSRSSNQSKTSKSGAKIVRDAIDYSIATGVTKIYNLTFAPTAVMEYNGEVMITSNSISDSTMSITVTGSGFIPPTIGIDNDSLEASLNIGAQGSSGFTISNSGSQDLSYAIMDNSVEEWFSVAPNSGTVNAGGSQLITVSFYATGLAPGIYYTTLIVVSNDPDHPELSVSIELMVLNSLATPVITSITRILGAVQIDWEAVSYATAYEIYRSFDPYGDYGIEPIATVNAPTTTWQDTEILDMAFYFVKAINEEPVAKQLTH